MQSYPFDSIWAAYIVYIDVFLYIHDIILLYYRTEMAWEQEKEERQAVAPIVFFSASVSIRREQQQQPFPYTYHIYSPPTHTIYNGIPSRVWIHKNHYFIPRFFSPFFHKNWFFFYHPNIGFSYIYIRLCIGWWLFVWRYWMCIYEWIRARFILCIFTVPNRRCTPL